MGGPMGLCDTNGHLHLANAIRRIEAAIGVGRPVLGRFPVEAPPPAPVAVFHWRGDGFDLLARRPQRAPG